MNHRFAAILAADVVRFSELMERDGEATVRALKDCRTVFERCVASHHGREFGSVGDSLMAEFQSPVEALRAARDIQTALASRDAQSLQMRIGLHTGDVISDADNLYGDIVNTASRLQELAQPGGITLSGFVHSQVRKESGFAFRSLGHHQLKNILEPVDVFEVERRHHAVNWRRIRLTLRPYKGPAAAVLGAIIAGSLVIGYLESRGPSIVGVIEVPADVEERQVETDSIAVLAFTDMSPEGDQEYLSDGIAEEILNLLAQVPDLRVISRSSAFSFKGKAVSVPEVARQLEVAYVLEGSVRKFGNRIRISAQLIDGRSDMRLWSQTYDRELEDIFAIQDEISEATISALMKRLKLDIQITPRVVSAANSEAHEAYLRGRYLAARRTEKSLESAVREFERAIEFDPDYAPAHADLAEAVLLLRREMYGSLSTTEAIARAAPHAERAMTLDPMLPEALSAAGYLSVVQWNNEQALTHFRQALQINPNYAIIYTTMGYLTGAGYFGRYDEGFAMTERALRLDPLSIPTYRNYIYGLTIRNRLDEADREIEKLAAISPSAAAGQRGFRMSLGGNWANRVLGILDSSKINPQASGVSEQVPMRLAAMGLEEDALAIPGTRWPFGLTIMRRHADAITIAEASLADDPTNIYARGRLGMALASAGDYERARPILEEMWQLSGKRVTSHGLFYADCAAALIAIRRDAGEEAEVDELVAAMKDNVRRYNEADITRGDWMFWDVNYEEGLAAYLAGDRERGLALIAKAVDNGFFIMPWEAYLQALYDDPGFAPIHANQQARQARERGKFLAIVCTDNPYAAFWQPAVGTCERFAVTAGN